MKSFSHVEYVDLSNLKLDNRSAQVIGIMLITLSPKRETFVPALFVSFLLLLAVALRGGREIGADAPGSTFWRGGIFSHQCPENDDLQLSDSRVVDRRT